MAEEKKELATQEESHPLKVGSSYGLTPFEEMERMMDRMERLFGSLIPASYRRGRAWMTPFEEMDRIFDEFLPRGWLRPFRREWPAWGKLAPFEDRWPKVDVIDRDEEVVVHAELPGIKKEDLDVSMTDDAVIIKGSSSHEEKEEKGDYYRRELARGEFSRTIPLPAGVDGSKAKATFKDGVMELVLPKLEKAKRRSIKID
jgi:HSP20 family protein